MTTNVLLCERYGNADRATLEGKRKKNDEMYFLIIFVPGVR